MDLEVLEDDERVDPNELDAKFQLLRKIENRKFIYYDSRDKNYSKREILSCAWEEIATDIKMNGKDVTVDWCKRQWKQLRDYYFKSKKVNKGKSAKSSTKAKPWIYFSAVDRMLAACVEENYDTQSNMEGVDSESGPNSYSPTSSVFIDDEGQGTCQASASFSPLESTPTGKDGLDSRRRKRHNGEEMINNKIMKLLDEPEELKDESYYFSMSIAAKLRRLPVDAQDYAMKSISDILYDLLQQHNQ